MPNPLLDYLQGKIKKDPFKSAIPPDSFSASVKKLIEEVVSEQLDKVQRDFFTGLMRQLNSQTLVIDGYTPKKGKDYFDGQDGKTPVKGKDYFTPSEVKQLKKEVTPIKGKDYPDEMRIVKDVLANIPKPDPDTPKEIVEKINSLPIGKGTPKISADHIKDLEKYVGSGKKTMARGGGMKLDIIDLSASCNGADKVFTISKVKMVLGLWCTSFPIVYRPLTDFAYTATSITLTAEVEAPASGQTLIALVIL